MGTGLTAVTDIYDNIYNEDIGEWVFTPQTITGTLTDFTIDLSFGAAGVAADYVINMLAYLIVMEMEKKIVRLMWQKRVLIVY